MNTDVTGAVWRKSSRSDSNGQCVEVALAGWRKSTRSDANGSCVEVGHAPGVTGVRDTKDPGGPILTFAATDWRAFTTATKAGHFTPS